MADAKWTQDMRTIMFRRLVQQFGPYETWGRRTYPSNHKDEYRRTLHEIAGFFSALTGETLRASAVELQIKYGYTPQGEIKEQGRVRTWILNKSAAMDAGFIKTSELPTNLRFTS